MGRTRTSQRRGKGGRKVSDLGAVPFHCTLRCNPRRLRSPEGRGVETPPLGGGVLSDLQEAHARGYKGSWNLHFGGMSLSLKTHRDLDCLEEFWVLLIELIDSGFGEWTLPDGEGALVFEAQVFGPDVQIEFACEQGNPRFRGRAVPRRATVRLRAFVEEGVRLMRELLAQVGRLDEAFVARDEVALLQQDLDSVLDSVVDLPRDFPRQEDA